MSFEDISNSRKVTIYHHFCVRSGRRVEKRMKTFSEALKKRLASELYFNLSLLRWQKIFSINKINSHKDQSVLSSPPKKKTSNKLVHSSVCAVIN